MKKLLFLIIAAACIIASCSKDDRFDTGLFPANALNKAIPSHVPVIVVPPDADGDGDDTDDLLTAIEGSEPGSVIKLLEGEYHLRYMEIIDFNVSIIGAGKDKTIIYPKTPLAEKIQLDANQIPCWLRVIGGEVCIAEMTFSTDVPEPIQDYPDEPSLGKDLPTIFAFADYTDKFRPDNSYLKIVVRNVNFIGGTDDAAGPGWMTDHNTLMGIWCGPDFFWPLEGIEYPLIKGEFTITGCHFDHFLDDIEGFGLGENAIMSVASSKFDNSWAPLYFTANYNSKINICNNVFSGSTFFSDVIIEDIDFGILSNSNIQPVKRCQYILTGNVFHDMYPISSVLLWDTWVAIDPAERLPMLPILKGNIFNLTGGSTGITVYNSQDAVISNNRFTGSCTAGIMIDGVTTDRYGTPLPNEVFAKNALVLGNNFSGLEPSTAAIVLGEKSMNCTVVGTGKEKVIDNGVNNKITGIRKVPGDFHFGPTLRDNSGMWRGMRHR
ncbi:MAG: hypothetical protein IQL11_14510 [Bacteroidales bacterium]|nr:hypothetical protein [Bacteroidales bacterium]